MSSCSAPDANGSANPSLDSKDHGAPNAPAVPRRHPMIRTRLTPNGLRRAILHSMVRRVEPAKVISSGPRGYRGRSLPKCRPGGGSGSRPVTQPIPLCTMGATPRRAKRARKIVGVCFLCKDTSRREAPSRRDRWDRRTCAQKGKRELFLRASRAMVFGQPNPATTSSKPWRPRDVSDEKAGANGERRSRIRVVRSGNRTQPRIRRRRGRRFTR